MVLMPVKSLSISINTHGNTEIVNITDQVSAGIAASGLINGIAALFCPSSTSSITTMEFEPGVVKDFTRLLDETIPADRPYAHHAAWNDYNGHSHVRSALLGPSLVVPFTDGQLTLGMWQQIVYVDFDVRARHRELVLQLIGE
jgi:secondary thiamine-phosphate synthase enzyme